MDSALQSAMLAFSLYDVSPFSAAETGPVPKKSVSAHAA
jgi:hypothetical protein